MSRKTPVHSHRAFGLDIQSDIPIPSLPPALESGCDIRVRIGAVEDEIQSVRVDESHAFWAVEDRSCHIVDGVGAFRVVGGDEVVVDPVNSAPPELIQLSLIGPVLGLALIQRGYFVLHGSTIVIDGQGVGFLGGFASGKSTLAAAMTRLGHTFVSDDLTAIDLDQGSTPLVVPGIPLLKLWPDAARSLDLYDEAMPRVHPDHEKRFVRVEQGFSRLAQPLKRLYVLDVGDVTSVEPLSAVQSFDAIVANWYGARFGPEFLKAIDLAELFLKAAQLARGVSVKLLSRPASLAEDPQLSEKVALAIVRDLQAD